MATRLRVTPISWQANPHQTTRATFWLIVIGVSAAHVPRNRDWGDRGPVVLTPSLDSNWDRTEIGQAWAISWFYVMAGLAPGADREIGQNAQIKTIAQRMARNRTANNQGTPCSCGLRSPIPDAQANQWNGLNRNRMDGGVMIIRQSGQSAESRAGVRGKEMRCGGPGDGRGRLIQQLRRKYPTGQLWDSLVELPSAVAH